MILFADTDGDLLYGFSTPDHYVLGDDAAVPNYRLDRTMARALAADLLEFADSSEETTAAAAAQEDRSPMTMHDSANPRYPVAGDPDEYTPDEHAWYRIEGMAHGIYQRHATALARSGTRTPHWEWLTEMQRETWRTLARERAEAGWDSAEGF